MTILQPRLLIIPLALDDEDLLFARLAAAMSPPAPMPERVHPTSNRIYLELPLAYRDADEQLGWPLLAWLSTLTDQAGTVTDIYDRIDRLDVNEGGAVDAASALANPAAADDSWLAWLGQHVGVVTSGMTPPQARAAIVGVTAGGFTVATKQAIAAAAATALTGTRFVQVYDHSVAAPGDGGQWDVLIVTRGEETPDPTAVTKAVVAAGAKPAGVVLRQRSYSASWTAMTTAYPTWADRNGHTWLDLEEAGL